MYSCLYILGHFYNCIWIFIFIIVKNCKKVILIIFFKFTMFPVNWNFCFKKVTYSVATANRIFYFLCSLNKVAPSRYVYWYLNILVRFDNFIWIFKFIISKNSKKVSFFIFCKFTVLFPESKFQSKKLELFVITAHSINLAYYFKSNLLSKMILLCEHIFQHQ